MSVLGPLPATVRRAALAGALCVGPLAMAACGNTLQDQPIPHNTLETLVTAAHPVYWLGGSFEGLKITEAGRDPGGAYFVQYGDCLEGGQGTCLPPLRVITSPDNSFVPGQTAPHSSRRLRGVSDLIASEGRAIAIPTADVVVAIYADSARLATAAARQVAPINLAGAPGERLPAPVPDTGFGQTPLPGQTPPPLRALG